MDNHAGSCKENKLTVIPEPSYKSIFKVKMNNRCPQLMTNQNKLMKLQIDLA